MQPTIEGDGNMLFLGDCLDVMPHLKDGVVDAVITSPPYAEQRKGFYDGVPGAEYPQWTVAWMDSLKHALKPDGSVLINIREHVKDGQISDYVHRTRLAVREAGWIECDELIWVKHNAPPLGHNARPRRSWERVLWFSQSRNPFCDSRPSSLQGSHPIYCARGAGLRQWVHGGQTERKVTAPRDPDFYYSLISTMPNEGHPASYSLDFAQWMIKLVCPDGGVVLDPFMGSGTTGVACINLNRRFVGIEKSAEYFKVAAQRIEQATQQQRLELAG